ncbi:MAG: carbon storage regulator [Pirellulaceae bacterium]
MLVLSRKRNQQIIIGDHIVVTILAVHRNRVKLGVASPVPSPIDRSERMSSEAPLGAKIGPSLATRLPQ